MNFSKINFENLGGIKFTDAGAIALIAVGGLMLLAILCLAFYWIKYSLVRNTNSQNLNGAKVTEKILSQTPAFAGVQIKKSILYSKYWNHNKRRNTYRLRPWTYSRESIWTIMEATSQAYASTIRAEKGKAFWFLFRLPALIRGVSVVAEAVIAYLLINSHHSTSLIIVSAIAVVGIPFLFANCGALYMLMKNTMPLVRSLGLTEKEVKAVHKIFVVRFLFSVIATILDLIKIAIQLAELTSAGNAKKR